jgi:hypothetical protein
VGLDWGDLPLIRRVSSQEYCAIVVGLGGSKELRGSKGLRECCVIVVELGGSIGLRECCVMVVGLRGSIAFLVGLMAGVPVCFGLLDLLYVGVLMVISPGGGLVPFG